MARAASGLSALLCAAETSRPDAPEALAWLPETPAADLLPLAESLTLAGFGATVTYSRKVFIPLTQLCRDVCHYCTEQTADTAHNRPEKRSPPTSYGRRRALCVTVQILSAR